MTTGLVLKDTGATFTPAPEGQHVAVCVDVVDLGIVETTWKDQKKQVHKCRIVFEIGERMQDGRPFTVSQQFTASLGEKANLRKFLESWRGRAFTKDELAGFDTEQLIGAPAVVQVVHAEKGDRTYANINSVMKLMKGLARLAPSGQYIRVKDRVEQAPNGGPVDDGAPPVDDDDVLPF